MKLTRIDTKKNNTLPTDGLVELNMMLIVPYLNPINGYESVNFTNKNYF